MPTWLAIVLGALVLLVLVLAVGGYLANRRAHARGGARFEEHLLQADRDLAAAHAADRGWARETLEASARRAFDERHPGEEPRSVALVQVVDRPGTDEDKAVFLFETAADRRRELTLSRRGDEWVAEG